MKIRAPFTEEQVELLSRYQGGGLFHPYTCGQRGCYGQLVPVGGRSFGWRCEFEDCEYTQNWAHDASLQLAAEELDLDWS